MSHDQPRHSSLPVTHCLTSLSFYLVPLLLSLGYNDCLAFPQTSQKRRAFAIAILTIWDALSYSMHVAGSLTPFKPLLKISPDEKGLPHHPTCSTSLKILLLTLFHLGSLHLSSPDILY